MARLISAEYDRRGTELARMRPVVAAALAWLDNPMSTGVHLRLRHEVQDYRAALDGQETRHA